MLPKPSACQGCPFYGDGQGFTPDEIKPQAEVCVFAQGPGADEEAGRRYLGNDRWEDCLPAPLTGKTGWIMERTFLPLAGLNREDVSLANSIRCRYQHQNDLPPIESVVMRQALEHCTRAHWKKPEGVKLYVAMGEHAFHALTGLQHDFSGWRGYLVPARDPRPFYNVIWTPRPGDPTPVLVTHHIAYIWKEPEAELPMKRDWNKIPQILAGRWPIPLPEIDRVAPNVWPTYSAYDTEFGLDKDWNQLVRFSSATKDHLWVVEARQGHVEPIPIMPGTTIVMHNAPADLPHAGKMLDLSQVSIEDTMYAHAVLWTGKVETDDQAGKAGGAMSHTLNFLGSIYARINRWKHLAELAPITYSGGDAFGTLDVWSEGLHGGIRGELQRDPRSLWVYDNLQKPLIPIVVRMRQRGIAVDAKAAEKALKALVKEQSLDILQAQAVAGWAINLRSPKQVAWWLYDIEQIKLRPRRNV